MSSDEKRQIMQIGEFAKKAGVSARAVRYYEEMGLIKPAAHSNGGFRLYEGRSLRAIRVIGFLKDLGLTLTEIREIFGIKSREGANPDTIKLLLKIFLEKLDRLEVKIDALEKMRAELVGTIDMLHSCKNCSHKVLLDALECDNCTSLRREDVPDTFDVLLQS
jgi:MerR family Zn(II)-responsive transcriptional regulator of zntA